MQVPDINSGLSPHNKTPARVFFHEVKTYSMRRTLAMLSKDFQTVHIIQTFFWYLHLSGLRWQVVLCVLFPPYSFSIYFPGEYGLGTAAGCHCDLFFTSTLSCAAELNKERGEKVSNVVQSQSLPQLKLEHGIILTPSLNAAGLVCFLLITVKFVNSLAILLHITLYTLFPYK